jgi:hypothetical protein
MATDKILLMVAVDRRFGRTVLRRRPGRNGGADLPLCFFFFMMATNGRSYPVQGEMRHALRTNGISMHKRASVGFYSLSAGTTAL